MPRTRAGWRGSPSPTRIIPIVAGIVVSAVGGGADDRAPERPRRLGRAASILGGPALFLVGNLWFKALTARWPPLSHLVGLGLFAAAAVIVPWLRRSGSARWRWRSWSWWRPGSGCRSAPERARPPDADLGGAALQHRADAEPAGGDGGPAGGGGRARLREPPDPSRERQPDLRGRCAGCARGRGEAGAGLRRGLRQADRHHRARRRRMAGAGAGQSLPGGVRARAGAGGGAGDARAGAGRGRGAARALPRRGRGGGDRRR